MPVFSPMPPLGYQTSSLASSVQPRPPYWKSSCSQNRRLSQATLVPWWYSPAAMACFTRGEKSDGILLSTGSGMVQMQKSASRAWSPKPSP
jgi:hypothetical protein